jgi:hypothetical protein
MLAELREACLERSEKRMPIWRVRFAPDLVAQIQPKPVTLIYQATLDLGYWQHRVRFEGRAVAADNATGKMLEKLPPAGKLVPEWWSCRFEIVDEPDDAGVWLFKVTGGSWSREGGDNGYDRLRGRVLEQLSGGFFDVFKPENMLSPACLFCVKPLTDPALPHLEPAVESLEGGEGHLRCAPEIGSDNQPCDVRRLAL